MSAKCPCFVQRQSDGFINVVVDGDVLLGVPVSSSLYVQKFFCCTHCLIQRNRRVSPPYETRFVFAVNDDCVICIRHGALLKEEIPDEAKTA